MTDWSSGYVTDSGYMTGLYRDLTPNLLTFLPLVAGNQTTGSITGSTYCELGCGQGYSANLFAAANPHISVHANDFNPAHIAGARALAAESGTTNVRFSDASFADYADDPELPEFDIIALHGIYSWISAENRAHIVEFIRRKLKVGGLVFVSYNCQPGWGAAEPLRQLMVAHGATTSGTSVERLGPALDFIEALKATNAGYFSANPALGERFDKLKVMDKRYLAHEYMNADWTIFHFADVARELSAAKLDFVSSVHLPDRIDTLSFNAAQKELMATITDPVLRETVRDYVQNQQFRRDLFAKGAVPLPRLELDEAWLNSRFALTTARAEGDLKVQATVGEVALKPEVYDVILKKFEARPQTVRELLTDSVVAALGWAALREAITLLVGYNRISPALDAAGDAKRAKRTAAFNAAVMKRAHSNGELNYLASPVIGGGVAVGRLEQLLLAGRLARDPDPIAYVERVLASAGERLVKDGAAIEDPAAARAELAARDAALEAQLPLLRQLGVI